MIIKDLKLINFRNYSNTNIILAPTLNYIYGKNAQGKTNILESIYYLANMKSFRISQNEMLIQKDCFNFYLETNIISNIENNLTISYSLNKKEIQLNKKILYKNKLNNIPLKVVLFQPEDVTLFTGLTVTRRDLFDDELAKLSPLYSYTLTKYKNTLKDRSTLTKDENFSKDLFNILTSSLASLSELIVKKRIEYVEKINQNLQTIFSDFYKGKEKIVLEYNTFLKDKTAIEYFNKHEKEDILLNRALIGPHNDDYILLLDGQNIKNIGSQGENRISTIALKLAMMQVYENEFKEKIVILLDDVLSELDNDNQERLLKYFINKNQVLITSTTKPKKIKGKLFEIVNGEIVNEKITK